MILGIDASNLREGGGTTHLIELLSAAEPEAYGCQHVVVWGGTETLRRLPERSWLRMIHEPLLDQALPYRLAWQRFKLDQALRTEGCTLFFAPGGSFSGRFQPFVTMSRNMLPFEPVERQRYGWSTMGAKLRALEVTQRRSLRQADGVIFLTRYAQRSVQQRIGRLGAHQTIIPHGIAEDFRLAPRPSRALSHYAVERPFRLVYVSIISVYKHQWNVAEAVAQLRRRGFPVVLDLVGPAYAPALRRLQEVMQRVDPNQESVRYLGSMSYHQLPALYHQSDAFVYASSCENLPNILLEAMAAGLPVACSDRGPMPEILGQAGVYFNPEKVSNIADALETLLLSPELRKQYAQLAFEQSQAYTWERCAHETFAFLAEIAYRSTSIRSDGSGETYRNQRSN